MIKRSLWLNNVMNVNNNSKEIIFMAKVHIKIKVYKWPKFITRQFIAFTISYVDNPSYIYIDKTL